MLSTGASAQDPTERASWFPTQTPAVAATGRDMKSQDGEVDAEGSQGPRKEVKIKKPIKLSRVDRPANLTDHHNKDMAEKKNLLFGIENFLKSAKLPPEIRRGFNVHEKFTELDKGLRTTQVDLN